MDLGCHAPNVVCRCGTLLFSWSSVLEHWDSHKREQAASARVQEMLTSFQRQPRA